MRFHQPASIASGHLGLSHHAIAMALYRNHLMRQDGAMCVHNRLFPALRYVPYYGASLELKILHVN